MYCFINACIRSYNNARTHTDTFVYTNECINLCVNAHMHACMHRQNHRDGITPSSPLTCTPQCKRPAKWEMQQTTARVAPTSPLTLLKRIPPQKRRFFGHLISLQNCKICREKIFFSFSGSSCSPSWSCKQIDAGCRDRSGAKNSPLWLVHAKTRQTCPKLPQIGLDF